MTPQETLAKVNHALLADQFHGPTEQILHRYSRSQLLVAAASIAVRERYALEHGAVAASMVSRRQSAANWLERKITRVNGDLITAYTEIMKCMSEDEKARFKRFSDELSLSLRESRLQGSRGVVKQVPAQVSRAQVADIVGEVMAQLGINASQLKADGLSAFSSVTDPNQVQMLEPKFGLASPVQDQLITSTTHGGVLGRSGAFAGGLAERTIESAPEVKPYTNGHSETHDESGGQGLSVSEVKPVASGLDHEPKPDQMSPDVIKAPSGGQEVQVESKPILEFLIDTGYVLQGQLNVGLNHEPRTEFENRFKEAVTLNGLPLVFVQTDSGKGEIEPVLEEDINFASEVVVEAVTRLSLNGKVSLRDVATITSVAQEFLTRNIDPKNKRRNVTQFLAFVANYIRTKANNFPIKTAMPIRQLEVEAWNPKFKKINTGIARYSFGLEELDLEIVLDEPEIVLLGEYVEARGREFATQAVSELLGQSAVLHSDLNLSGKKVVLKQNGEQIFFGKDPDSVPFNPSERIYIDVERYFAGMRTAVDIALKLVRTDNVINVGNIYIPHGQFDQLSELAKAFLARKINLKAFRKLGSRLVRGQDISIPKTSDVYSIRTSGIDNVGQRLSLGFEHMVFRVDKPQIMDLDENSQRNAMTNAWGGSNTAYPRTNPLSEKYFLQNNVDILPHLIASSAGVGLVLDSDTPKTIKDKWEALSPDDQKRLVTHGVSEGLVK